MGKAEKARQPSAAPAIIASSDDDMDTDGDEDEAMPGPDDEEEAPDLYRNSALGM